MTSLFAGGGVRGGQVIGASDDLSAYPADDPYTVENIAGTVFGALGLPRDQLWRDIDGRPHEMYRAEPIRRLF